MISVSADGEDFHWLQLFVFSTIDMTVHLRSYTCIGIQRHTLPTRITEKKRIPHDTLFCGGLVYRKAQSDLTSHTDEKRFVNAHLPKGRLQDTLMASVR